MRMRLLTAFVLALVVAGSAGCGSKKKDTRDALEPDAFGEEGLGAEGSLAQYRQGRLGEDSGGPLRDVLFDYDSYDLREDARATLRENAAWLQENPKVRVEIEGHCDERGTVEYNLALGARRARAVRDYLVALGVSDHRMTTISYGEELPLCHEQSESCWQRNRRAHFVVRSE